MTKKMQGMRSPQKITLDNVLSDLAKQYALYNYGSWRAVIDRSAIIQINRAVDCYDDRLALFAEYEKKCELYCDKSYIKLRGAYNDNEKDN